MSAYKIILTSDATHNPSECIQHYGVKGMKWGVVHDEEEKRRIQSVRNSVFVNAPPVGPAIPEIEADRRRANRSGQTVTRIHHTPGYGDITLKTQPSVSSEYKAEVAYNPKKNNISQTSNSAIEKATKIIDDLPPESRKKLESAAKSFLKTEDGQQLQKKITEIVENSSGEINDETVKEIMGVAVDAVQSEELMEEATELMDTVKDVALDELEKENPTLGKAAKAVDSFIDSVNDFVDDFIQSVNEIVGNVTSWIGNLFEPKKPRNTNKPKDLVKPVKIKDVWGNYV